MEELCGDDQWDLSSRRPSTAMEVNAALPVVGIEGEGGVRPRSSAPSQAPAKSAAVEEVGENGEELDEKGGPAVKAEEGVKEVQRAEVV